MGMDKFRGEEIVRGQGNVVSVHSSPAVGRLLVLPWDRRCSISHTRHRLEGKGFLFQIRLVQHYPINGIKSVCQNNL